ncbi:MAG: amidophosphoribosyltransferase [Candidatus Peregrinibacteria bacterium GW2011_GWF2_33_10]|nr:MAG: amidophosphoribosyltransferase [Candidatus Peregrinibacteria bacterium GW2011_GWF2_33_10]OGJ44750.1 MAG: hypothetical protein A2263_02180 [Candidatus Peregrinibacteria bacterium RIFOXYA2_FULL_33_21]OGJ46560.1 MAG: hypothetical protein A2272_01580 [Candidatus Peregrinibacteria bacterium RIFOXYA12_FULL_33_12]OGJ51450.1 MAG: hypothetical protein A2307_05430 [Candidatus Peregrinibacteria bacterium RIFOXYB2_FULL_33_20]
MNFTNLINFITSLLFPIKCLWCGFEGEWICKKCEKNITLNEFQSCPICKHEKTDGSVCSTCKNKKSEPIYFNRLIIAAKYEKEHLIQKLIKTFKYRFIKDLNIFLGDFLIKIIKKDISNFQNYILIPVPLHNKKLRWRGFNQSELLAKHIADDLKINIDKNTLKRIKHTKPQAELERNERLNNLKNAFAITDQSKIYDKKIILIDDIATTLTTLNECAKTLKNAHAKEIICVVIGRGK